MMDGASKKNCIKKRNWRKRWMDFDDDNDDRKYSRPVSFLVASKEKSDGWMEVDRP